VDLRRVDAEQADATAGPVSILDVHRVSVDDLDDLDGRRVAGRAVRR
jgi:hypothetical protein